MALFRFGRMSLAAVLVPCSVACSLASTACSPAHADRPGAVPYPGGPPPRIALDIAPARVRAPYDVQILRGDGEPLPTYGQHGRFYVQGAVHERYTIRITNPTGRRVEAVVTVDGLDVIDGENGDLRKRGYVVPAYGETRIEGFRTSASDVATFRFSSVGGSYAGQKGKARNVGVIAVAVFEEQPPPPDQEIIVGEAAPRPRYRRPYDDGDGVAGGRGGRSEAKSADRPATIGPSRPNRRAAEAAPAPSGRQAPPAPDDVPERDHGDDWGDEDTADLAPPPPPASSPHVRRTPRQRPGLGTEFGEQRTSAASFTRFMRAGSRPVAIAELRYNDAAGLIALGIPVQPIPDAGEIMLRETADPFPGDRFARPPR